MWAVAAIKAVVALVDEDGEGEYPLAVRVVAPSLVAPFPGDARAKKKGHHPMADMNKFRDGNGGACLDTVEVLEVPNVPRVGTGLLDEIG